MTLVSGKEIPAAHIPSTCLRPSTFAIPTPKSDPLKLQSQGFDGLLALTSHVVPAIRGPDLNRANR